MLAAVAARSIFFGQVSSKRAYRIHILEQHVTYQLQLGITAFIESLILK